jgi:hypothetical protein
MCERRYRGVGMARTSRAGKAVFAEHGDLLSLTIAILLIHIGFGILGHGTKMS